MILCNRPPFFPFLEPRMSRLPGVVPLNERDWIATPEDLNAQLAYRDRLVRDRREDVLGQVSEGTAPVLELLDVLLGHLDETTHWAVGASEVTRPDGVTVTIDRSDPLAVIGRMVSEDFCILAKPEDAAEYVLIAGALCFPSLWILSEKLGKPLTDIHEPVPNYDGDLAKRVNRIFDGIRAEQLLLRFNWSLPVTPELHATPAHVAAMAPPDPRAQHYLRVERQTFRRLPGTGAVIFGIRTAISPLSALAPAEAGALLDLVIRQSDEMFDYKDGGTVNRDLLRARLRDLSEPGRSGR